ncbi:MAG: type IV secretory system conjugative DNA transfer family protein [Planctomycetota bacterium]
MNNYGPRTIINILAGIAGAMMWLRLLAPSGPWPSETWRWVAAAWAIALVYVASYALPFLRRRLLLPVTLPAGVAALLADLYRSPSFSTPAAVSDAVYAGLAPALLLAGPLAISSLANRVWLNPWFRENFRFGDGDNATWANRVEFNRRVMKLPRQKNGRLGWTDRILLGATTFRHDVVPRLVGIKTGVHLYTVGMSNSGKSATSQWANFAMYGGAGLIVDMKGEHAAVTGKRRSELGPVSVLDPLGVTGLKGSTCNVLLGIDETTDEGLQQIAEIRQAIVLPENETASGPHFADNAGTLLEGVITWVCHTQPTATRNLATVYRIIESRDPVTGVYDEDVWQHAVAEMSRCPIGQCAAAAKLMVDADDREGGSFLTTLSKSLKWMASRGMQEFLSGDENPLRQLPTQRREKPTIYVVVGIGNEQTYSRYIRLMVAMGVYYLRHDFRATGKKPTPSVLVSLDEYPLYAKGLDAISSGFGNLREAGCLLWVCAQKNSQVREAIGDGLKLLLQSSTVQVFGVNNDADDVGAWVSDQLGKHTLHKKQGIGLFAKVEGEKVVPLMTRRAVEDTLCQHSPNQFVFPADGGAPMWLHRRAYKPFRIDGKRRFRPLNLRDVFQERLDPQPQEKE